LRKIAEVLVAQAPELLGRAGSVYVSLGQFLGRVGCAILCSGAAS
jgi:hypothetical protein